MTDTAITIVGRAAVMVLFVSLVFCACAFVLIGIGAVVDAAEKRERRRLKMKNIDKYDSMEEAVKAFKSACAMQAECEECPYSGTDNHPAICSLRWAMEEEERGKLSEEA